MKNFKLTIEYDGTGYHGWQRQKHQRSIQAAIERRLAIMTGETVVLTGSGRTDAGVHALGQVASFRTLSTIPPDAFRRGLNSLLPGDIVIRECTEVDAAFHARYDVTGKRYHYRILNRDVPSAVERNYVWHVRKPLDVGAMRLAARHIRGVHDFKAFEGTGSPRSTTVRHITHIELVNERPEMLVLEIEGNGFLRFMVRNIVSTLVDAGVGKISPDDVRQILLSRDRSRAGPTAPPTGLFLISVTYE
jgi:tRNA pseudouridine38-40 synthase